MKLCKIIIILLLSLASQAFDAPSRPRNTACWRRVWFAAHTVPPWHSGQGCADCAGRGHRARFAVRKRWTRSALDCRRHTIRRHPRDHTGAGRGVQAPALWAQPWTSPFDLTLRPQPLTSPFDLNLRPLTSPSDLTLWPQPSPFDLSPFDLTLRPHTLTSTLDLTLWPHPSNSTFDFPHPLTPRFDPPVVHFTQVEFQCNAALLLVLATS